MIERDNKFETQFTLSLMVLVLGVLASQKLGPYSNTSVSAVFLLFGSIHLILLSVNYSFNRVSQFEDDTIRGINRWSRRTLRLTTIAFLYLVFYMLTIFLWNSSTEPIREYFQSVQILLIYGVPIIPVVMIAFVWRKRIRSVLQTSQDLSFTVAPESLRVYHDPSESKALRISVNNESRERDYELDFNLVIPSPLQVRHDHEWKTDSIEERLSIPARSREPLDFELKHESMSRKTVLLRAQFKHEDEEHEEEIECDLRV